MGNNYKGLFKEHASLLNLILRLLDMGLIAVCGYFAFYLSNAAGYYESIGQPGMPASYIYVLLLAILLSAVFFPMWAVYRAWRGSTLIDELRTISLAWVLVAFVLAMLALFTKTGSDFSRTWIGTWFLLTWAGLVLSRVSLRGTLRWMRAYGFNKRLIVIVGTGELARVVANRVHAATWTGFEIAGFINVPGEDVPPEEVADLNVACSLDGLTAYVEQHGIDQVWIAMPLKNEDVVQSIMHHLRFSTADIRYIPDIFGFNLLNHSFTEVAGLPIVNLSATPMDGVNGLMKLLEDYILGIVLLAIALPVMLVIAILLKIDNSGPVIYKQKRHGWDGRVIKVYKFRTMLQAEEGSQITHATRDDPRTTRIGSFLRKTSLDELPQLFNVLQGRMSIVGPRPHAVFHNETYKNDVEQYMLRHKVKPGITGWAQVNGLRGEIRTIDNMKDRVKHDLYYIENWSLWLDLKIILMTLFKGLMHKNAY